MVHEVVNALPVSTPFDLPFSAKVFAVGDVFDSKLFTVQIPDNIFVELISFSVDYDTAAGIRSTSEGSVTFSRGGMIFLTVPAFKLTNNQVGSLTWAQFGHVHTTTTNIGARQQNLPAGVHLYPDDLLSFDFTSLAAGDLFGPLVFHGHTWEVY